MGIPSIFLQPLYVKIEERKINCNCAAKSFRTMSTTGELRATTSKTREKTTEITELILCDPPLQQFGKLTWHHLI
jgi:hypothetical protein